MFVELFFDSRAPLARSGARVLGCLLAGMLSHAAQAQTALIAHRSHGGSVRTFRPARSAHNFGELAPAYQLKKIVWLSQARAVYHWQLLHPGTSRTQLSQLRRDTVDVQQDTGQRELPQVLESLRQRYPQAQLVGFDSPRARASWPSQASKKQ